MKDVGLDVHWEVINGSLDFFNVTKKIHNALQGMSLDLSEEDMRTYLEYNRLDSETTILRSDFVVIHDNQPAAMIQFLPAKNDQWIWRCHIDLSTPNTAVWNFLEQYIRRYDAAEKTLYLLNHKEEANQIGNNGKEHVKKNFLIVDDLKGYLTMFADLLHQ
jgi:trehalose synthase